MDHITSLTIGELTSYSTAFVFLLGIFFEISPIKFNPISASLGWLGKRMNRSIESQVNTMKESVETQFKHLEEKVDDLEKKTDDNEVYRLRHEILEFSNNCQNARMHTREEFNHILDALDRYEIIVNSRGIKNGQIEQAHEYVARLYQQCCDNNRFL